MNDLWPVIVCDSREQTPLCLDKRFRVERLALVAGDYSILGFHGWERPGFSVERKTIPDLVASLTRERARFMRELEKLRWFQFAGILIEGVRDEIEMHTYRGLATPQSLLASLDAIEVRLGIHVLWAGTAEGAARRFESLARQFARGVVKDAERLEQEVKPNGLLSRSRSDHAD